jgi:hypothetical protein
VTRIKLQSELFGSESQEKPVKTLFGSEIGLSIQ